MASPDTLLIPYEDYDAGRFTHVGRYAGTNQFMGFVTYASPKFYDTEEVTAEGQIIWREHTNCFAVLHEFDSAGHHLGTKLQRVEGTQDSIERDWNKFEEMIASLGKVAYCDIKVKPFQAQIGKVLHGLIYECERGEDGKDIEWVMLQPNDIMFHPPWDSGDYST